MLNLSILALSLLAITPIVTAQDSHNNKQKWADTSFSIQQTLKKEVKLRPYITLGTPDSSCCIAKTSDIPIRK